MFRKFFGKKTGRSDGPLKVLSTIENGLIVPPNHLELITTDQCNMACRACNHFAPIMPRWMADADLVKRDCALLAKVYRPKKMKVLGGEPLLHKDFPALVSAAREEACCR